MTNVRDVNPHFGAGLANRYFLDNSSEFRLQNTTTYADLKKRGVGNVDDLYHILHHWVHDDAVLQDEQQQLYFSAGI